MHPYNRILGLTVLALSFAAGCGSSKKIDVGDTCTLNSDCKSPLTCSMGKCHEGCRASTDCQPGQTCTKVSGIGVCQLPAEADCKEKQCGGLLICAPDLKCRSACQTASTDCMDAQVCVQSLCADKSELDVTTGQLPQLVIADGGLDAQSGAMNPEAGRADTARSTDVAPASPDLRSLSPDTAVASPDTTIMSSMPDAPALPADTMVDASFDTRINTEASMPDVPYWGTCGEEGWPCCAGDTCTSPNSVCTMMVGGGTVKICQICGNYGGPCCSGDTCTSPGIACLGNPSNPDGPKTCQLCGTWGNACCAGDTCTDSSECKLVVTDGGTSKMCQGCGKWGSPCCAGDTCTESNTVCAAQAGGDKTCQRCGSYGNLCCLGDTCDSTGPIATTCQPMSDGTKTCRQCGSTDQACCPGDTCQNPSAECMLSPDAGATGGTPATDAGVTVVGKICRQCGGSGQPCCSGAGKDECSDNMAICESGVCCGVRGGPCCSNDLCTYPNEVCALPLSGAGTSKTCQPCGSNDGPCCAGNKCPGGGVCLTTTNTCVACGRQNQPCCEGQQPCMNASFSCSGGTCTCTPPPVPVVTATPGNGQVVLTWPAPPVADSGSTYIYFTINRSVTSGSRYSVLERYGYLNGSGSPTYTDASVANGVTYYYTVSAEQDSCTSAASAEVSAKPSP